MNRVFKLREPIIKEMEIFEEKFSSLMLTRVPLLNRITHYIIKRKGKQMRPMLIFLCSKLISENEVNEKVYRGASVIELIHTATLIHDDVIDDSKRRRGFFSINAIWKNKIAVLVGDFLLSKGMLLCIDNKDFDHLEIISESVKNMSEGELLQIEKTRRLNITEDIYFDIIRKKTAALISACCESGASSSGTSEENINLMKEFGEKVGIAFQIKDDLFDYTQSPLIGKPTGLDIREKKMTLPLIYTLNNISKQEKRFIINTIKNDSKNSKKIERIILLVKENKGLEFAEEKMNDYYNEALGFLEKIKDSEAKTSLIELVKYVVKRQK